MASPSFRRDKAKFQPQPTVLIICEDSKSSKRYLEDAAYDFRAHILVQVVHCGKTDPLNIAKEALRLESKFDLVYCVIDRDRHESFDQAVQLVRHKPKIELIVFLPML